MKTSSLPFLFLAFLTLAGTTAHAQTTNQKVSFSGNILLDVFGGPDGDTEYPQYAWTLKTRPLAVTGYGFLERTPREALFTNHVNTLTWNRLNIFSVRTETGGAPTAGNYFFQVGPQVNLHQIVPRTKKVFHYVVVSSLPKLAGLRPPNVVLAFGTRQFQAIKGAAISAQGYRRFFPGGHPDYAEYWLLVHPGHTKPVSFGVFVVHHGSAARLAGGVRITLP